MLIILIISPNNEVAIFIRYLFNRDNLIEIKNLARFVTIIMDKIIQESRT